MSYEFYVLLIVVLLVSLLLVFFDIYFTLMMNYNEYKKSSFRILTNFGFFKVTLNKRIYNEYLMFNVLEKSCMNGHLLANVKMKDDKGEEVILDLVMIDKFGISVFCIENDIGTISGNANMPFWRLKKLLFTYKIPNYSLVMNRKIDVLKEKLKIKDENIITSYLLFDNKCKFKSVRIDNRRLKILKKPYVNGVLAYETASSKRVLSDNEIMAYTILLEKFTNIPMYIRDEKIIMREDENDKEEGIFTFEYHQILSNYNDLKKLWDLVCKCDKEVMPPFSLRRKDIEEIPTYAREMLLPNVFYKHIINHPLILIRRRAAIVGFLSLETNKVMKISEELGRVNLVNAACVAKEYRKNGLVKDLYEYLETRLPEENLLPYIIAKSCETNMTLNKTLKELGYKEKVIVDTKKQYGVNTIYYFKKINIESLV